MYINYKAIDIVASWVIIQFKIYRLWCKSIRSIVNVYKMKSYIMFYGPLIFSNFRRIGPFNYDELLFVTYEPNNFETVGTFITIRKCANRVNLNGMTKCLLVKRFYLISKNKIVYISTILNTSLLKENSCKWLHNGFIILTSLFEGYINNLIYF